MPIAAGARLGPYEVLAPLGRGGMGEVYRARDTRLDRSVAIKILAADLAGDPSSRARLLTEARAISLLNHPNICALYDIGSDRDTDFLVMELLEGETLAERLRRGALKFTEVVRVGIEIAQALDAAHAQGLVHGDLKPGNVMLTSTGAKLLDFGIARTAQPAAQAELDTQAFGATVPAAWAGTLAYMSPEQIEGQDVDMRADVFAFGTVLYEMATGRRAFEARSDAALVAAILEHDPVPPSDVLPALPKVFDRLVALCLRKNPEDRWQSIRDILFQLRSIAEASTSERATRRTSLRFVAGGVIAVLAIAGLAALVRRTPPQVRAAAVHVSLPPESRLEPPEAVSNLAVSPDGSQIAFVATDGGRSRLWVRALSALTASSLPGTEDARMPFWSPDSQTLGFFAAGKLLRVQAAGGVPQLICEVPAATTPDWGRDGTILFAQAPDARRRGSGGIYSVPANGGTPIQLTLVQETQGESEHYWPSFLPDAVHFLYVVTTAEGPNQARRHTLVVGSTADRSAVRVGAIDSRAMYSRTGHVLYGQGGALLVRRFDARTFQFTGDPIQLADRLAYYEPAGLAQFSISDNGVLVYHGGPTVSELVWFDRSGHQTGTLGARASYNHVRISPDGRKVALEIVDPQTGSADIWIHDRDTEIPTRFTSDAVGSNRPVWSDDGRILYFRASPAGPPDIFQKRTDGRGNREPRLTLDGIQQPMDASLDGRYLAYLDSNPATIRDIWLLPLTGPAEPRAYVRSRAVEQDARFSPDGRWLAFVSSESGRAEVYVGPVDDPGARRRVSRDGGLAPRWRRDGKELVYVDLSDTFVAVDTTLGDELKAGAPRVLFSPGRLFRNPGAGFGEPYYDLAPDGQSLLVNRIVREPAVEPITVILDWPSLLPK